MLLVALAAQRNESKTLRYGEIKQRAADRGERRRLIVLAPEARRTQFRCGMRIAAAQPRARRILGDRAGEMREARARSERQPGQALCIDLPGKALPGGRW